MFVLSFVHFNPRVLSRKLRTRAQASHGNITVLSLLNLHTSTRGIWRSMSAKIQLLNFACIFGIRCCSFTICTYLSSFLAECLMFPIKKMHSLLFPLSFVDFIFLLIIFLWRFNFSLHILIFPATYMVPNVIRHLDIWMWYIWTYK